MNLECMSLERRHYRDYTGTQSLSLRSEEQERGWGLGGKGVG